MPALVVNTNVSSLNGQRNLYTSQKALSKAMERLSSGLRINRSSDDAAGMAISENLRSQIRGVNQAVRNCNDGVSLIQTAEGAMDTYTQILQRIRELAVQSSNDTNSDDNRQSIQLEVKQQLNELDRISKTMSFNGQNLFDGTFTSKRIQAGSDAGDFLDISVQDLRTSTLGTVAQTTGTFCNNVALVDGATVPAVAGIQINGVNVPASLTAAGNDKVNAINSVYASTKVQAVMEDPQTVGTAAIPATAAFGIAAGNYLIINGVKIPSGANIAITADDSTGALRDAINAQTDTTGVKASLTNTGTAAAPAWRLTLTSVDDKDFTLQQFAAATATSTGLPIATFPAATNVTVGGRVHLISDSPITVAGNAAQLAAVGLAAGTIVQDPTSMVQFMDVSTADNAQKTIRMVDNAMRQLMISRSSLGAISNRLDNTVSNLQIASENMSASDSRIRDADFAAETAAMTRAQILQQSGVAILAQANMSPQQALSLLKGA